MSPLEALMVTAAACGGPAAEGSTRMPAVWGQPAQGSGYRSDLAQCCASCWERVNGIKIIDSIGLGKLVDSRA